MWRTSDMMNYIHQAITDIPQSLTDTKPDENGDSEVYEVDTDQRDQNTLLVKVTTYKNGKASEDEFVIQCHSKE